MAAQNDDLAAEALEIAVELREALKRIEVLLVAAKHLGPDQGYSLVREAYRISEHVAEESDELVCTLFEPDSEECVA